MLNVYYSGEEHRLVQGLHYHLKDHDGHLARLVCWHHVSFESEKQTNGWDIIIETSCVWPTCPQIGDEVWEKAFIDEGDEEQNTYKEYVTEDYFKWTVIGRKLRPKTSAEGMPAAMIDIIVELTDEKVPQKENCIVKDFD